MKGDSDNSDTKILMRGSVTQVVAGRKFRVALPNGRHVIAHISSGIRKAFVKVKEGDVVELELSPFDLATARITNLAPQTSFSA